MGRKRGKFLDQDVLADAKDAGANRYIKGNRYKAQRERIFEWLDGCVAYMESQDFGNPYHPAALGGFATAIVSADDKARGQLQNAKVKGMADSESRTNLFRLIGLLVADDYLTAHRADLPSETRLSLPKRAWQALDAKLKSAAEFGTALSQENHYVSELAVRFTDDPDPLEVAQQMIADAVDDYEADIPEAADEVEVPDPVERRAIATAALMRLHVDSLEEEAANHGIRDAPTKAAMARAIAERYVDELDKVAEIVLRRERGDSEYGLITRLVPLQEGPSLDKVEAAFGSLFGRYIESRIASFFVFGAAERRGDLLEVHGKIRSFTVNPAEAGGTARINARPYNDAITIRLRADVPWAEVNARRTSDLATIRSVLRRTGAVVPAAAVAVPDRLSTEPYTTWDPRTLWMLDFMRRDLRSDELRLDNTLMAHFLAPEKNKVRVEHEVESDDSRRPSIDAVRLFGSQLQDHPEACQRIASGARLRDLDVRVRHVTDLARGHSRLVRFRLSWEDDHLAVLSGVAEGQPDAKLHQRMVKLVRDAAPRELDEDALKFTLRQIQRRAVAIDIGEDEPGILDDEQDVG